MIEEKDRLKLWLRDEERREKKRYLLPSIRLPGRGLPLNMAAAHPKGERIVKTQKRNQERQ